MSIPLFNLIVVNERALMGKAVIPAVDRYMENIIRHGAVRCYVFQTTVLVTGFLLAILGPTGIEALWKNWILTAWILMAKLALLLTLMGLLSYVNFRIQPGIDSLLAGISPDAPLSEEFMNQLRPLRVMRKRLAAICLFLVITSIVLGLQVYRPINPLVTTALIFLGGVFALRAHKSLVRFGWL
ncbi:MAG: hypothetical protein WA162_07480 [Thermodesulfobacteriota bacterium]